MQGVSFEECELREQPVDQQHWRHTRGAASTAPCCAATHPQAHCFAARAHPSCALSSRTWVGQEAGNALLARLTDRLRRTGKVRLELWLLCQDRLGCRVWVEREGGGVGGWQPKQSGVGAGGRGVPSAQLKVLCPAFCPRLRTSTASDSPHPGASFSTARCSPPGSALLLPACFPTRPRAPAEPGAGFLTGCCCTQQRMMSHTTLHGASVFTPRGLACEPDTLRGRWVGGWVGGGLVGGEWPGRLIGRCHVRANNLHGPHHAPVPPPLPPPPRFCLAVPPPPPPPHR